MNNSYLQLLRPYHILPKNPDLYLEALTHSSYANEENLEKDYQRLEFMGDAVLQLWSTQKLFKITPAMDEGKMTTLRAQLVCEEALASYNRQLGLGKFLKLGVGEEKTGGREHDTVCVGRRGLRGGGRRVLPSRHRLSEKDLGKGDLQRRGGSAPHHQRSDQKLREQEARGSGGGQGRDPALPQRV